MVGIRVKSRLPIEQLDVMKQNLLLNYSQNADTVKKIIIIVFGVIFFGVIGFMCLFYPNNIQKVAIKYSNPYFPFYNWTKSKQYIISLRIIGFFGVCISILLLLLLITAIKIGL